MAKVFGERFNGIQMTASGVKFRTIGEGYARNSGTAKSRHLLVESPELEKIVYNIVRFLRETQRRWFGVDWAGLEQASTKAYLQGDAKFPKRSNVAQSVTRFLGDTPGRVLVKLIVISFVVGVVMSAFNWSPFDVLYAVRDFFLRVWDMGFSAIERFFGYFLLGACIVVPAFVLLRLLNFRK